MKCLNNICKIPNFINKAELWCDKRKQLWKEIFVQFRGIYGITFCTGLFAYGFVMTNVLNNYDSIAVTPGGYGTGIKSGRWFLTILGDFIAKVWGNYTLPLFNGIVAISFISLSACIICALLKIQTRLLACTCGMLFISFPTFASTMLYIYTVHYYAFAILLTVIGVYFGTKEIWGGYFSCCFLLFTVARNLSSIFSCRCFSLLISIAKKRLF